MNTIKEYINKKRIEQIKEWKEYLKQYSNEEQIKIIEWEGIIYDEIIEHKKRAKELNITLTKSISDILLIEEKLKINIYKDIIIYDSIKKNIKELKLMPIKDKMFTIIKKTEDLNISKLYILKSINKTV